MPNHVHMIVVPEDEDGLRRTFADAHRRYTGYINARLRVTGHLWQGRFGSVVMDEDHLAHAVRYVSLNPVRAGLVDRADQWSWSSVRAHLDNRDDGLVTARPVLDRYGPFDRFVDLADAGDEGYGVLRRSETTGRPVGSEDWISALETKTGRVLSPQRRGPRPRNDET